MSLYQNKPIVSYETWATALFSSAAIGCTSLVPWLFNLTFFEQHKHNLNPDGDGRMKFLLSFSIGAILGDIFFHLIPESFHSHMIELNHSQAEAHRKVGLSVISGIFMFIIVEMLLQKWSNSADSAKEDSKQKLNSKKNVFKKHSNSTDLYAQLDDKDLMQSLNDDYSKIDNREFNNNSADFNIDSLVGRAGLKFLGDQNNNVGQKNSDRIKRDVSPKSKHIINDLKSHDSSHADKVTLSELETDSRSGQNVETAGYLSLIANGFDNFTHGLAIGASFLVGPKVGLLTTFVIFIHEIPHEICDYAILVNSGFSRLDAVKAQSSVSLFGILGTAIALYVKSLETLNSKIIWILPFSAGGFLYVALVNLLPEILEREINIRNTIGQVACVILGISFMAAIAIV